ncbi:MAG: mechanosensitive ion channel family protein [Deltaproteobacteria bacterium]|nr:mechanosensitive ion channel family protein [Deltaproteobacteria bacterium]
MEWNKLLDLIRQQLVIDLSLILTVTFFMAIISRKLFRWLSGHQLPPWLISLLRAVGKASPLLILIYGGLYAIETILRHVSRLMAPESIANARHIFLAGSLCWLILRWKSAFIAGLNRRLQAAHEPLLDNAAILALNKLSSIVVITVTGLLILDLTGVPVSTLLAFGGVGGLAISWAAKDVVANFFGGLMIYVNRPFGTGDWIKSPNKNFEGVVEEIGWYRTQIRTFERRPTYIPNAMITDAIIENPGRMYNRRIMADIGLRYQDLDKIKAVITDIRQMLRQHPDIDQEQALFVHFAEYGAYSVNINIYTFTKTTNWEKSREIRQDILLRIADIVRNHQADFAFPTQNLLLNRAPTD